MWIAYKGGEMMILGVMLFLALPIISTIIAWLESGSPASGGITFMSVVLIQSIGVIATLLIK
jgi:hypothetical protein